MNVGVFRRILRVPFLFLVAGGLVLGSCDSGGLSPDRSLRNGVALSGSENPDVAAVATHRDGEWLAAYSRDSLDHVSEVVYGTREGDRVTIKLDSEGRPSMAVTGPSVVIFGNYNGTRADVGLVNTESDTVETSDQVDLGVNFGSLDQPGSDSSKSDSTEISPAQAVEVAGYGATAFVCALAEMPVPDSSVAGTACQSSVLLQAATGAAEQDDWKKSAELIGWGGGTAECADSYGASCVEALAEVSGTVLEKSQAQIDENEQSVAQAYAVIRFEGTWEFRDPSRWFVIEENLSYNIYYNDFGNCYYISSLEILEFEDDMFRYKIQEKEEPFWLKFSRVSPDVLAVTRLSDDEEKEEFTWDRAPSQDLQTFSDNECSSSSTARANTVLGQ